MSEMPVGQIIQHTQGYWAFYPTENKDIYGRPVYTSWDKQTLVDWVDYNYYGKPKKVYERKSASVFQRQLRAVPAGIDWHPNGEDYE